MKPQPDGSRKRRHSPNSAKREWYANFRAIRFARHLGFTLKMAPKGKAQI